MKRAISVPKHLGKDLARHRQKYADVREITLLSAFPRRNRGLHRLDTAVYQPAFLELSSKRRDARQNRGAASFLSASRVRHFVAIALRPRPASRRRSDFSSRRWKSQARRRCKPRNDKSLRRADNSILANWRHKERRSYPRREHYSSSSTCSFQHPALEFARVGTPEIVTNRFTVDVFALARARARARACERKKAAITCRGTFGSDIFAHFLRHRENFCQRERCRASRAFRSRRNFISFSPGITLPSPHLTSSHTTCCFVRARKISPVARSVIFEYNFAHGIFRPYPALDVIFFFFIPPYSPLRKLDCEPR